MVMVMSWIEGLKGKRKGSGGGRSKLGQGRIVVMMEKEEEGPWNEQAVRIGVFLRIGDLFRITLSPPYVNFFVTLVIDIVHTSSLED